MTRTKGRSKKERPFNKILTGSSDGLRRVQHLQYILSRYNSRDFFALELEPLIAGKARERQKGGQGGVLLSQKSVEAKIDTQKEIAGLAGVSHDTIAKVKISSADVIYRHMIGQN
jgi:hypothetical protein